VESSLRGWPLATFTDRQDTDTNYKRILDYALRPSGSTPSAPASPVTTSSMSPMRGCSLASEARQHGIEFEMLGMATGCVPKR
jgi:hypothetical protein